MATTSEQDFARELGVSPDLIASLAAEHLKDGLHVEKRGRRTVLTDAGRAELRRLLGLEKKPAAGAISPAEKKPGGPRPLPVTLRIVRLMPNPTCVQVRTPAGTVADVRVRAGGGLRAGHGIACINEGGIWIVVDPRHAAKRA